MKPKRLFKSSTTNYMWAGGDSLQGQVAHPGNNNLALYTTQSEQYNTPAPAVPMANFDPTHSNVGKRPYSGGAASHYKARTKNTVTDDQLGQGVEMTLPEQQGGSGMPSMPSGPSAGGIASAAGSVAGVISDSIEVDYDNKLGNDTLGYHNFGDASQHTTKGALKGVQTGAEIGGNFGPAGTIIGMGIGGIAGSIAGGKKGREELDAATDSYNASVDSHFANIDAQKGKYGGRLRQYGNGGDLKSKQDNTRTNINIPKNLNVENALNAEESGRAMGMGFGDELEINSRVRNSGYISDPSIEDARKRGLKHQQNLINNGYTIPFGSNDTIYREGLPQFKDGGDLTEFNGEKHEQGGIALPAMDAEVEDGETSVDNYVFSDSLNLDKDMIKDLELPKGLTGKSFADASKHLNKKFPRENDMFANKAKERYFERLKAFQESVRPKDPQGLFKYGGYNDPFARDENQEFRETPQNSRLSFSQSVDNDIKRWNNEPRNVNNNPTQYDLDQYEMLDNPNYFDDLTLNGDYSRQNQSSNGKSSKRTPRYTRPNNTRRSMPGTNIQNGIDASARMAPIITSGINLGRNMKPNEKLDLDMFNTSVPIEENLVDRSKIHDDINISARAADHGLRNASGGSRSSYLNNRLGLLDRTLSAQTNARISSDTADAAEKSRVAQLRLRQDAMNQRNRYGVQTINDQNEGVREGLTQDSIANLGNQMGDYGTEGYRRNSVNSMYDYKVDRTGNVHYKNKKKKK